MKKTKLSKLLAILLTVAMTLSIMVLSPLGVSASTSTPKLWVNGVDIIADDDNTIECGGGTAVYDIPTTTLTLTNALITTGSSATNTKHVGIHAMEISTLNIMLNGTNTIQYIASENGTDIRTGIHSINTAFVISGNNRNTDNLILSLGAPEAQPGEIQTYPKAISTLQSLSVTNCNIETNNATPALRGGSSISVGESSFTNTNIKVDGFEGAINSSSTALTINNTTISATNADWGLKSGDNNLSIKNSTINITSTGVNQNAITCGNLLTIDNSTVNASSYYPVLYGETGISIENSTVKATSTNDAGIFTPADLSISGNSTVDASGLFAGIQSNGNMTISGGTVKANSTNDIGMWTRGTLNITGGTVTANGGTDKAAIGARAVKIADETTSSNIILGTGLRETSGGKIAVSDWFLHSGSGETRNWTSFISKDETNPLATDLSNALNQVTIHAPTPPTPAPSYNFYTIETVADANGTISPTTSSVIEGSTKTYTITPNEGYVVADVLVDGVSVGKVATYTFTNIMARHKISASFVKADDEKPEVALPPATKKSGSFAFAKTLKDKKANVGDSLIARVTAGRQTFNKEEVGIVNSNMKIKVKSTNCTVKIDKTSKTSGTSVVMKFTKAGTARVTATIQYDGKTYTKVLTVRVGK